MVLHDWWECILVQPLWKTVWRFLKDLAIETPFDPAIPLLGICTQRITNHFIIKTDPHVCLLSTVHNSKNLETTQMPIDNRLDWKNVAHMHHGMLCSHKKGWVHVLFRVMDEAGNNHSQQTDTRRENQQCMFSLTSGCWTMRTHGHREGNITQ